ncbi:CRISPR-associated protein Cas4 [uncultured Fluviicola sp.]|uniref:CRISPR-associated protein Cas4 n=1 Tax=uncultured Fluviicola sp. TaxID=463303 RepID=UPI0025EEED59|nr:CRISPR-associated protein Cas4 [uncultured Fluviicola sp.]
MQHRGEIVERAIRKSGYPISQIARKLGKSRRWMYLMFDNSQVDIESIISIGKIIHHDFSDEIKELSVVNPDSFSEQESKYNKQNKDYWKNKYLKVLESYNALLKKTNPDKTD